MQLRPWYFSSWSSHFFATSSHAKPQHVNVNKHDKGLTRILSGLLGVGVDVIRLWVKLVSRKRYPPSVMGLPPIPLRQCMREIKRLEFANAASLGSLNLHAPSRNLYETFGTTLINHSWSLSPAGWFRSTYRFGRLVATLPNFRLYILGSPNLRCDPRRHKIWSTTWSL